MEKSYGGSAFQPSSVQVWQVGCQRQRAISFLVKGCLLFDIFLIPTVISISMMVAISERNWITAGFQLLGIAIYLMSFIYFVNKLRLMNPSYRQHGNLRPATESINQLIHEHCQYAKQRLNLTIDHFNVWIHTKRYDSNLGIIDIKGTVHLIISLGFTKLITQQPHIARAMLCHELGHVFDKDTNLWALSSIRLKAHRMWILPILIPMWTILGAMICKGYLDIRAIDRHNYSLITNHQNDTRILQRTSMISEKLVPIRKELADIAGSNCLFIWYIFSLYAVILIARRDSEMLADLTAVMLGSGPALIESLTIFTEPSRQVFGFLRFHPNLQSRIMHVKKAVNSIAPSDGILSYPDRLNDYIKYVNYVRTKQRICISLILGGILGIAVSLKYGNAFDEHTYTSLVILSYGAVGFLCAFLALTAAEKCFNVKLQLTNNITN